MASFNHELSDHKHVSVKALTGHKASPLITPNLLLGEANDWSGSSQSGWALPTLPIETSRHRCGVISVRDVTDGESAGFYGPDGENTGVDIPDGEKAIVDVPDGEGVRLYVPDGENAVVDVPGGERAVVYIPDGENAVVCVSGGESAVFYVPGGKRAVVDVPGGEGARVYVPDGENAVVDVPDGERAVVYISDGENAVVCVSGRESAVFYVPGGKRAVVDVPGGESTVITLKFESVRVKGPRSHWPICQEKEVGYKCCHWKECFDLCGVCEDMEVAREFCVNGMIEWVDCDSFKQWFLC
ncbi:hypothetical protein PoB_000356600 [Plakobranchus ocellatus]|uniref:Uncharacterized protein n=1 Tax=Plakobranchus ocellatus TaxID=259542 RepID=A0AAV3XK05_9GAST|nr:hypothetical protein PoB_000356600 [Plakobranchus ocellatus]